MPPFDGHRQVDDPAHRRLRDDHVVERHVLAERLAVADDTRGQQHPLLDLHPAPQVRLQGREHLVERRGGEKSEAAQVHPEQRNAEIAHRPGHRQEGTVASEHDEQIDLRRQICLAGRDADHRRDQVCGLLL